MLGAPENQGKLIALRSGLCGDLDVKDAVAAVKIGQLGAELFERGALLPHLLEDDVLLVVRDFVDQVLRGTVRRKAGSRV